MRIAAVATWPLFADLCHQLMGIAGHVINSSARDGWFSLLLSCSLSDT